LSCYCGIYLGHALFAIIIGKIFDCPAVRCSKEPYFAKSLQEFWGERWNVNTQYCIKRLSYDKVHLYLNFIPKTGRNILATMAAFLLSALMHEWILWSIDHESSTFEQFIFFLLHGVLLIIEKWTIRIFYNVTGKNLLKVTPKIVLMAYTHIVLLLTCPLMLNPYIRCNVFKNIVFK
jgi:hypothetical protein